MQKMDFPIKASPIDIGDALSKTIYLEKCSPDYLNQNG